MFAILFIGYFIYFVIHLLSIVRRWGGKQAIIQLEDKTIQAEMVVVMLIPATLFSLFNVSLLLYVMSTR